MTRQFTSSVATRAQVNLIIGLVAPSSGGKTYSALELATGIQQVSGGDIEVIDTEHGRALFYADKFKFNHTPFGAPFASLDYLDAIQQAARRSKIIIVDSMSHEHESEGGMCDYQEQELSRMAGDDFRKRQTMQMLAWAKPKAARRKLLQGMTQVDAHLILCFRAKNSSKPGKDENGRSVVIPMGFVPIAGEEFVFEAALSALLPPNSRGVPNWNPDMPGERVAVKLPSQFEWLAQGKPHALTRQDGQRLAEWARGGEPVRTKDELRETAHENVPTIMASLQKGGEPVDLSVWSTELEEAIDTATPETFGAVTASMKSPEWGRLKEFDVGRAKELHAKSESKRLALAAKVPA